MVTNGYCAHKIVILCHKTNYFFCARAPQWARVSPFTRFLDHTQRHTIIGRTCLGEWSDRCWDLYLTTYNTHNRQTSMPAVGFEPSISVGERPQTHALDLAAIGTGRCITWCHKMWLQVSINFMIILTALIHIKQKWQLQISFWVRMRSELVNNALM
jgi:hypothetical protein